MKNVVFSDTGREVEFKPDLLFEKYLELTKIDLSNRFKDQSRLVHINCPACHSKKKERAFDKFGFNYDECESCKTVYLSPCPSDADIKDHYLNSASSRYWRNSLSKATEEKRKEKIYSMRLQWINDMADEYLPAVNKIADLRSMDKDFIQVFLNAGNFKGKIIIDPYFDIKEIVFNKSNTEIISDLENTENLSGKLDVVTAFEVLDNTSEVDKLLDTIKKVLVPGGLCFITTISISGFDLQVLWENSKTVYPPDRTKLFSNQGLNVLFKRHGFEMLEYSTPGVLDVDIVKNAIKRNKELPVPRFIRTLLERGDEQLNRDFQDFLQINKLSSFVRVVLRKRTGEAKEANEIC